MTEQEKKFLEYGAIGVGGVFVLLFVFHGTNASTKPQATGSMNKSEQVTQNPNNSQTEQALIAARSSALSAYDSTVGSIFGEREQLLGLENTNAAQTQQTRITTQGAVQEATIQSAAEQAIANSEAQAQEAAASQAAQAQEAEANAQSSASSGNWFSNIFGGLLAGFGL